MVFVVKFFYLGEGWVRFIHSWHGERQKQDVEAYNAWISLGERQIKSWNGRLFGFWIQASGRPWVGFIWNIRWAFGPWCFKLLENSSVWQYSEGGNIYYCTDFSNGVSALCNFFFPFEFLPMSLDFSLDQSHLSLAASSILSGPKQRML